MMTVREIRQRVYAQTKRAALSIVLAQGVVSADDIRGVVTIPKGIDPRIVGPAINALKLDGWLEEIGMHRTTRRVAHRRCVRDWRLKAERPAAEKYLADHPDKKNNPRRERGLFDENDA
jgi:hypothetical protein